MGLGVEVRGGEQLRVAAARIRATGNKGVARQMATALTRASAPLDAAIRSAYLSHMPSGYGPTLSRSLKFRRQQRVTGREASVRHTTYATGRAQRRDLPALERGDLRHPIYGRSRPRRSGGRQLNPWSVTRVTPGAHRKGTEQARRDTERAMLGVLDGFIQDLKG